MSDHETHDSIDNSTAAPRANADAGADAVARVLANADSHARSVSLHGAAALQDDASYSFDRDGDQFDREDRAALRRVRGLSTELEDVTEVEYRQLRLENVVLIGIYQQGSLDDAENSLRELAALAETAGAAVLDGLLQRRPHPDPSTFLGKGKAAELALVVAELGADTVIADAELAPSQRRALEDVVRVKVIDRTAVILDIFSQHAKSREGKAQVELAQLEYLLPRLRGWGESMSRQAGGQVGAGGAGMGSRGPGETKIELDRRRINTRMSKLRKQIKGFAPARAAKRANRDRYAVPSVAIAGYTNAGKSSLLNKAAREERVVVNEMAGTTRDPIDEQIELGGKVWRFVDTAGIRRRVHLQQGADFYASLRTAAALEKAEVAVVLIDVTEPLSEQDVRIIDLVLESGRALVLAFNKWDLLDDERRRYLEREIEQDLHHVAWAPRVNISARTGRHLEKLVPALEVALESWDTRIATGKLNAFVAELTAAHPHPVRSGKQPRILFATQASTRPPTFVLFTTGFLDPQYRRFITRRLREVWGFEGTPIQVNMRVREKRQR